MLIRRISGFRRRLTWLSDDEPITALALAVLVLLDVFILSIIFSGLNDHTRQLTSPIEYFPSQCRQLFIDMDWTPANRMEKLQALILEDYRHYSYRQERSFDADRIRNMHELCGSFFEQARRIAEDGALKGMFVERQQASRNKAELVQHYDQEHKVYNTKLLEDMAQRNPGNLVSMEAALKQKAGQIELLNAQVEDLDARIGSHSLVEEFWELARPGDGSRRAGLIADLNRFERIYLFRELFWQLLFLVPLLAAFCVWHARSVKKGRMIQGLMSAHLVVVAAVPVVIKTGEVVLELIPFHFFRGLFRLFERLHIIAIWHYLVIILAVAVALFVVFIIQKKIFSQARLHEKRLSRGACHACGKVLPDRNAGTCPFCGKAQFRKCAGCGGDTHITGAYCVHCGQGR